MTTTGDFSAKASAVVLVSFQSAHAVGDADRAQAAHAGVGIGGEAGALLVAGVNEAQLAAGELVVEPEHVIARDAEHMAHAMGVEPLDEVFANGRCGFHLP